jgi:phosphatidate cytidylyltransferase
MLRTRLWMGTLLAALSVGVLVFDQHFQPWAPFLLVLVLALALIACFELLHLLDATHQPPAWLCYAAVSALVGVNWVPHVAPVLAAPETKPWPWVAGTLAAVVLAAFGVEMLRFREPGGAVACASLTVWIAAYLGLLTSFLVQLRWLADASPPAGPNRGTLALALAVFVPKCGDIGAYFTGRWLGRHRMTPVLSPKKTWEGAAGGLAASVLATLGVASLGPVLPGAWAAAGFGVTVGLAGMVGDLAESLIKRDCGQKDASQVVPGFGGVLDVVDSVVFAAPVAYWWLH